MTADNISFISKAQYEVLNNPKTLSKRYII